MDRTQQKFLVPGIGLQPDSPRMSISKRTVIRTVAGVIVAPTSGDTTGNLAIDLKIRTTAISGLTAGDGVFIEHISGLYVPADTTGMLAISGANIGLQDASGIGADFNSYIPFNLNPRGKITFPIYAPPFTSFNDLREMGADLTTMALRMFLQVHNTDVAGAHTVNFGFSAIWRVISGMEE